MQCCDRQPDLSVLTAGSLRRPLSGEPDFGRGDHRNAVASFETLDTCTVRVVLANPTDDNDCFVCTTSSCVVACLLEAAAKVDNHARGRRPASEPPPPLLALPASAAGLALGGLADRRSLVHRFAAPPRPNQGDNNYPPPFGSHSSFLLCTFLKKHTPLPLLHSLTRHKCRRPWPARNLQHWR